VRTRCAAADVYAVKSGTLLQEMPGSAGEITAARRIIFAPESN
jgi:hypothetical protein